MSNESAVVERLQTLATAAAATTVATAGLAGDVLRRQRTTRRRRSVAGSLAGLATVGALAGATQLGHRPYVVQYEPSDAMSPTVAERESVLIGVSLQAQRGDVVAYRLPVDGRPTSLGRIIALAGDRVSCPPSTAGACDQLVVNGVALDEPYLGGSTEQAFAEETVPAGDVFIVGDNRAAAYDSRSFGPVDASSVTGVGVRIVGLGGVRRLIAGAPVHAAPGDTDIRDPAPLPTAAARPAG